MILTNTVLLTGSVYFCEKIAFVLVLLYVMAISGKKISLEWIIGLLNNKLQLV